jgi:type VI protein secretion system component VasK
MRWTTLLIDHPWLALLGATALAQVWRSTRSRIALVAAVLWVAYTGWEITLSEDRPDANIRIDLLVIYPMLAVLTAFAVWSGWRARRRQ